MQQALRRELTIIRFIQVAGIFGLGMVMFLFSKIPHSWWILVTVSVISGAIEPGLEVKKSISRGIGTLLAAICFVPLIHLLHFNYRLIPLAFILCACLIWVPNAQRYDISTIFITLMVFFLTAYTFTIPLEEGPIEMIINRGSCTLIGIIICLGGDYFVFSRLNYSRKVYYLLQHELAELLQLKIKRILHVPEAPVNTFLLFNDLRHSLNEKFNEIAIAGQSLAYDLRTPLLTKRKIGSFEKIIFELRREIFAIYYCEFILKDKRQTEIHLAVFNHLMKNAQGNFINLN